MTETLLGQNQIGTSSSGQTLINPNQIRGGVSGGKTVNVLPSSTDNIMFKNIPKGYIGGYAFDRENIKRLALLDYPVLTEDDEWEIKFRYLQGYAGGYGILTSSGLDSNGDYSDYKTPAMILNGNSAIYLLLSSTGNSWNIAEVSIALQLKPQTFFDFKYGYRKLVGDTFNPVLERNGNMEGFGYGANASHTNSSYYAWKAFDKDWDTTDNCWYTGNTGTISTENPVWITFYTCEAIKPTAVTIKNEVASPVNFKSAYIQGSNDNETWDNLYNIVNRPNTTSYIETYPISTNNTYKYIRLWIYESYQDGASIQEMQIDGFPLDKKYYTNPLLSSNGTMGGNDYACAASSEGIAAYGAFDGDITSQDANEWWNGQYTQVTPENPAWLTYYTPKAITPSAVRIYNPTGTPSNLKNAVIQGSNDNTNWDNLYTISNSPDTGGLVIDCPINTNNTYKYFRLYITDGWSQDGVEVQEMVIYGNYKYYETEFYLLCKEAEQPDTAWQQKFSYVPKFPIKVYWDRPLALLGMKQSLYSNVYWNYGMFDLDNFKITVNGESFFDGETAVEGTDFENYGCDQITKDTELSVCRIYNLKLLKYYNNDKTKFFQETLYFHQQTFNSFEWCFKIKYNNFKGSAYKQVIFGANNNASCPALFIQNNVINFYASDNSLTEIGSITGTTTLVNGNYYYFKLVWNGETYKLYSSTDGTTWTQEGSTLTSSTKIYLENEYVIGQGQNSSDNFLDGLIDMEDCYIKLDGKDWWKGVN